MTVNPILVVRDSLPEYKQELIQQREKLVARTNEIDDELNTIQRLQQALVTVNA